jgi:hypothetical protein
LDASGYGPGRLISRFSFEAARLQTMKQLPEKCKKPALRAGLECAG